MSIGHLDPQFERKIKSFLQFALRWKYFGAHGGQALNEPQIQSIGILSGLTFSKLKTDFNLFFLSSFRLGNTMQDAFLVLSVYRRTLVHLTVRERLAETYSEAMSSITINVFTNCSFYTASYFLTSYKAVSAFRKFWIKTIVRACLIVIKHLIK